MEKKAVRVAYGEALVKLGEHNDKVVVLDADLAAATMTGAFKKAFPERFFDCGIAEANMVDLPAGITTRSGTAYAIRNSMSSSDSAMPVLHWEKTAAVIRQLKISR